MPLTIKDIGAHLLEHRHITQSGCWLWTLATNGNTKQHSYGVITHRGKKLYIHRLALEVFRGESLAGRTVIHTCDTPRCFNPDHLRIGTQADNMEDCSSKGRPRNQFSNVTNCKNGHPLVRRKTQRICPICVAHHQRARRALARSVGP